MPQLHGAMVTISTTYYHFRIKTKMIASFLLPAWCWSLWSRKYNDCQAANPDARPCSVVSPVVYDWLIFDWVIGGLVGRSAGWLIDWLNTVIETVSHIWRAGKPAILMRYQWSKCSNDYSHLFILYFTLVHLIGLEFIIYHLGIVNQSWYWRRTAQNMELRNLRPSPF